MAKRKNAHAVALGRLGGQTVTPKKRAHLAKISALGVAARQARARRVAASQRPPAS